MVKKDEFKILRKEKMTIKKNSLFFLLLIIFSLGFIMSSTNVAFAEDDESDDDDDYENYEYRESKQSHYYVDLEDDEEPQREDDYNSYLENKDLNDKVISKFQDNFSIKNKKFEEVNITNFDLPKELDPKSVQKLKNLTNNISDLESKLEGLELEINDDKDFGDKIANNLGIDDDDENSHDEESEESNFLDSILDFLGGLFN